ncbi:MAG: hypothetical protein K2X53_00380 [Alphaproteobacteria bacterium]|nr:hypothetical protein [Alphaproteobacteria bacterium]
MPPDDSSFEALEKQLARDALEKALKDLHGEINKEIDKNKRNFSDEIKRSLAGLTKTLETHISKEIDRKLPFYLKQNFSGVNEQIKDSFNSMFSPLMEQTQEDMGRLRDQGKDTLLSWKDMMEGYSGFWKKPFFLMMFISVMTGGFSSLVLTYLMTKEARMSQQFCESTVSWYLEHEKAKAARTAEEKESPIQGVNNKAQKQPQKKTK